MDGLLFCLHRVLRNLLCAFRLSFHLLGLKLCNPINVSCAQIVILFLRIIRLRSQIFKSCEQISNSYSQIFKSFTYNNILYARIIISSVYIPNKKRNAPLRTVQLSGRSQVICQFSLYQCKGMSSTAASHVFCNQASKLC